MSSLKWNFKLVIQLKSWRLNSNLRYFETYSFPWVNINSSFFTILRIGSSHASDFYSSYSMSEFLSWRHFADDVPWNSNERVGPSTASETYQVQNGGVRKIQTWIEWLIFSSFMRAHAQAMNKYGGDEMSREVVADRNLWTEIVDRRRKWKCPASLAPWLNFWHTFEARTNLIFF